MADAAEATPPPAPSPPAVKRGKDAEFMKMMREKAAAKRAELKKIKDAELLKAKQAHEQKLKDAESILKPPADAQEPHPPVKKASRTKKPVEQPPSESEEEEAGPSTSRRVQGTQEEPNYKQMYYRAKLERLGQQQGGGGGAQAVEPRVNVYDMAREDIRQGVNKKLYADMIKQIWG